MNALNQSIQTHGAQAVYNAASQHMADGKTLAQVGLRANNMGDVWRIQSEAYAQLGDGAKIIDAAKTQAQLDAFDSTLPAR